MLRQVAVILTTLALACGILAISILRTASIKYNFSSLNTPVLAESHEDMDIDYTLAYPGSILPDHPFWYLKVIRDKAWHLVTTNPGKKAELNLLFADKRLGASKVLFERNKPELAYSTLTKAAKYLEAAARLEKENREKGMDTSVFLTRLANCSLLHRHTIEEILIVAPDDARPKIIETQNYSKNIYKETSEVLRSKGLPVPENPFNED